jgi:hypothetical protein
MCFSPHAFIIAIGMADGHVSARDTLSRTNQRTHTMHTAEISALSFSRDTHHLASGDRHGCLKIHSVDTCEPEFTHTFDSQSIRTVEFAPACGNHLLILLQDSIIHILIDLHEFISSEGTFSYVKWSCTAATFFAASEQSISQIEFPSLNVLHHWDFDGWKSKRNLTMALSLNGLFLFFLDKAGVGRCFSLEAETVIWECSDQVHSVNFAQAVFDRSSEYVIVPPKTGGLLRLFRVLPREDGIFVKTAPGSNEPILQLFSHPLDTAIFARCPSGIVHWEPSTPWRMKNSVPPDGLMRANEIVIKPKDFFDKPAPEEAAAAAAAAAEATPLKHGRIPLDLTAVEPVLLPDDKRYPDQLLVLTWPPPPGVVVFDSSATRRRLSKPTIIKGINPYGKSLHSEKLRSLCETESLANAPR